MNHMNHIKHKIARFLFADEVQKIDIEREAFKVASKMRKDDQEKYNKWMLTRSVTDAMREQLKGFDFKENEKDFINSIPPDRMADYLDTAVTLKEGELLPFILDYLRRQQVEDTVNQATTMEHINFARSTLNGIELVRESIDSLVAEFERRNPEGENFDKHSAV